MRKNKRRKQTKHNKFKSKQNINNTERTTQKRQIRNTETTTEKNTKINNRDKTQKQK